jgi:hypothetical protein
VFFVHNCSSPLITSDVIEVVDFVERKSLILFFVFLVLVFVSLDVMVYFACILQIDSKELSLIEPTLGVPLKFPL